MLQEFSEASYVPAKPMRAASHFPANPFVPGPGLDWYDVATVERIDSDMAVLWWLTGPALMVLSFVVWVAGMQGKEAILSIGKATVAETRKEPKTDVRPVKLSNVVVGLTGILVGLTIILVVVF
jgi:hypothetical protein